MKITRNSTIEEIVGAIPGAVEYLMKGGIRCIICGEPTWDTLEEAARQKGFPDEKIDKIVRELNEMGKWE